MALKDIFKKIPSMVYTPSIYVSPSIKIEEQFKGIVPKVEVQFPQMLGDVHPFDYTLVEGIYKEFGMVTGIIDKYVDFVVGPGFYVKAEDERAKQIIEDFMKDTNFDTLLRAWLKEALIKGTGYMEIGGLPDEVPTGLKVLNANWMYIKRDEMGNIEGYNQYVGRYDRFTVSKVTPFKP